MRIHRPKQLEIEARYGKSFWLVVRELAGRGLNFKQAAREINYSYGSFIRLLKTHGERYTKLFGAPPTADCWIERLEDETGRPIAEALSAAANDAMRLKQTVKMMADEIGAPYDALRNKLAELGIIWPRVRNDAKNAEAGKKPGARPCYIESDAEKAEQRAEREAVQRRKQERLMRLSRV